MSGQPLYRKIVGERDAMLVKDAPVLGLGQHAR